MLLLLSLLSDTIALIYLFTSKAKKNYKKYKKILIIGFDSIILGSSYHVYSFLTGRLGPIRRVAVLDKWQNTGTLIKAASIFFA